MTADDPSLLTGLPREGEILAGKYRVEKVLGIGGMGAVVAATHLHLDEKVAIKFLHTAMTQHSEIVTRFMREGKAVIKIRSEHAVKVHDVGMLESGAPYLVMEYLDGSDLSQVLGKQGAFRVSDAVDLVLQASEAIAEAHTLGIVHRDLKPANLFLTTRADGTPSVKVLDFGISKSSTPDGQDMGMTKTQAVMGSPRYMSPEQMRSTRNVDARTDIWALGVILYELLSGGPPFNAETMTELCAQILQDVPQALIRRRNDVPPGLDAAIQRCLAKNPDERFTNIGQLAMAIADFGGPTARPSAERIARVMQARGVAVGGPARLSMPSSPQQPPQQQPPMQMPPPGYGSNPGVGTGPGAQMGGGPLATSAPRVVGNGTNPVWGSTTGPPKKSGSGALIAILVGVGVLVIGGVAVVGVVAFKGHGGMSTAGGGATTTAATTTTTAAATTATPPAVTSAPVVGSPPPQPVPSASTSSNPNVPAVPPGPGSVAVQPQQRPLANNNPPPVRPQPVAPVAPPQPPANPGGMFDGRK